MSVSYVADISDGSGFLILLKLLARWKGSLYKLVWLDLIVYLIIFYLINALFWFLLNSGQKETFHIIVAYCEDISTQLPVSFVLGFFVSGVVGRWFQTFVYIPWLNEITYTVMIITMRRISDRIARRFRQRIRTTDGIVKEEIKCVNRGRRDLWSVSQVHGGYVETGAHLLALLLQSSCDDDQAGGAAMSTKTTLAFRQESFLQVVVDAGQENTSNYFSDDLEQRNPLVNTADLVAVISVYSYIFCQIIGAQYVNQNDTANVTSHENALPVPIFSVFYFMFLIGWLKVALCVMNPFGDDYEDFECCKILDFNLNVTYRSVLLDEATYPESLKTATFKPRPMKGAESDNLQDFLDNVTREIQETDFNEDANE
ncbi:unnamed protein product [Dibothriocephalus latus]|uniref:Bestrophin homolog n=1 Tax=Dibothriocephalus latus TaxID=60516 RepID=A0A3P6U5Y6_DIBLA|nr:unnamed protein product [Dibothriocephalus latus]